MSVEWRARSGSLVAGIVGYLAFLMTVDVPMYLHRWRAKVAAGGKLLRPLDGLRDASTRWVVTYDLAEWKDEIVWMSLYFSLAVWSSLALCVVYRLLGRLCLWRFPHPTSPTRPAPSSASPPPPKRVPRPGAAPR